MTTLSRRATPRQQRLLRIVEGAVRDAANAHPEYNIPARFAGQVAKRAVGTLTDQWDVVLAASAVREAAVSFTSAVVDGACRQDSASQGSGARVPAPLPIQRDTGIPVSEHNQQVTGDRMDRNSGSETPEGAADPVGTRVAPSAPVDRVGVRG